MFASPLIIFARIEVSETNSDSPMKTATGAAEVVKHAVCSAFRAALCGNLQGLSPETIGKQALPTPLLLDPCETPKIFC